MTSAGTTVLRERQRDAATQSGYFWPQLQALEMLSHRIRFGERGRDQWRMGATLLGEPRACVCVCVFVCVGARV